MSEVLDEGVVAWLPTIEICLADEAGDIVKAVGGRPEEEASLSKLQNKSVSTRHLHFKSRAYLFRREEVVRPCHRVPSGSLLDRRRAPLREMMLGDEAFDSSSKRVDAFWRHCSHVDANFGAETRYGLSCWVG
jgi:hypothetical protein